jgi:hypothetical protein
LFVFAAFLVAAALLKVGAPVVSILLGVAIAGYWKFLKR